MKTFEEKVEWILQNYDTDLLLEVLQIEASELLDRFEDTLTIKIEEGVFDDCEEDG